MNQNLTEIVCIIDRSTSIRTNSMIKSTIEGFNSLLAKQKAEPGECKMTVVLFDSDRSNPASAYEMRYDGENIQLVEELTEDNFIPKGMTALYDSIGRTVDSIKTRLSNTPADERPGKTIVAIITDGEENSSVEYKKDTIKKMIEVMEKEYNWTFMFIGAGIDAMADGTAIGASLYNTVSFASTSGDTIKAYNKMSSVLSRSRGMDMAIYSVSKDSLVADTPDDDDSDTIVNTTNTPDLS
jgi:hypothetical protein